LLNKYRIKELKRKRNINSELKKNKDINFTSEIVILFSDISASVNVYDIFKSAIKNAKILFLKTFVERFKQIFIL
jgi:hypothetical protein